MLVMMSSLFSLGLTRPVILAFSASEPFACSWSQSFPGKLFSQGWECIPASGMGGQNIIKDEGMVKFAVEKNWRNLQFASLSLRHNKSVILHAIRSKTFLSRKAFIFADESLRNDPDFVLECLKQPVERSHEILTLVDHSLLQDQDFAQAVRNLGPTLSKRLDLLLKK